MKHFSPGSSPRVELTHPFLLGLSLGAGFPEVPPRLIDIRRISRLHPFGFVSSKRVFGFVSSNSPRLPFAVLDRYDESLPTAPKRVLVTGYYGFGNAGDEVILASLVQHLRALRPEIALTVTSATPARTASAYGVEAVQWNDAASVLDSIRSCDLVIIGGGGIFHDYWGFDPNAIFTDNHAGISFYTGPAILGALNGKPVMLYGVGIGPVFSGQGRLFTTLACEASVRVTVRDEASRQLLLQWGVPSDKVELTADPVFGLEAPVNAEPAEPRLGVALRNWNIGIHPSFWEREVATALDRFVAETGVAVVFIPFQRLESELEDDLAVARRVQARMSRKDRTTILEEPLTPEGLLAEIASCELMFGMRLHASVLAAVAHIPAVSLSYDPKVKHAMQRLELESFSVDLHELEAPSLARTLTGAWENRAVLKQQIASKLPEIAAESKRNAAIAIHLIDRGEAAPLTSAMVSLLARSLENHIAESHALNAENRHLFKEFEFYQRESQRHLQHVEQLSQELDQALVEKDQTLVEKENEKERLEQQAVVTNAALAETKRHLEAEQSRANLLQQLHEESVVAVASLRRDVQTLTAHLQRSEQQLAQAEELRSRMVTAADQFARKFDASLATYRSQRAWRIMLWFRKAYWLLANRGIFPFAGWLLSGSRGLEDLELEFPSLWNYLPERLEVPVASNTVVPATPAPQPTPVNLGNWLPQQRYDVVILAIFDFEFRFQRPQQIAAELARRGHRVFWISPARVLPKDAGEPFEAIPLRDNLWEIHLRGAKPELYTGTEPPDPQLLDSLRHLYAQFAIAENCAILQFPHWRQIGLGLREQLGARLVYDCMDDWQNWTAEPRISDFNLAEERALSRDADVLVVTSQEFYERQQAAGLHPVLARNAADFDFFASPRANELLSDVPKPIIGYYGAIADWFDRDLVTYLAESRPDYSFVLIGGVHKVDVSRLEALPNVRFYGEKNYREIPLYLAHFDVALIPFVLNKLTKGVDPVKMYEYFSQGKPVVATDMAELGASTDLLYIGRTREEFLAHIDTALDEKNRPHAEKLRQSRIAFAAANTWGARVDAIDTAIRESFGTVSILIVTYNSLEFIEPCLDAVLRNTAWPKLEIVVVDNASTDGTRKVIERYASEDQRIKGVYPERNLGFAGGNNLAAKHATGDFLVFLNADTIVPPGWLERLVRPCRVDPKLGAVAAVTNFSGNETKINIDYRGVGEMLDFARKLATEKAGVTRDIPMAPLYCVLVPRAVWHEVGELDTNFEVGMFEDDDFSTRIRNAGYRVISAEDAFIHHFGNGSFAKLPTDESLRIFERNRKRFEAKWGITWTKHSLRPGVRPPYEETRLAPAEFLILHGKPMPRNSAEPAELKRIHPATCAEGRGFNVQPDGRSALVVECERATPSTVITWNGKMLETAFGGTRMLSAVVPPEFYARAGSCTVRLWNDFGESNPIEFVVSRASNAAAD